MAKLRRSKKISRRTLEAALRDSILLLREFQWPLFAFLGLNAAGGYLYYRLAAAAGEPPGNYPEAIYQVLGLVFISPIEEFPQAWYLQIFYLLIPLIGLSILAQGIADFGILFFNRRERGKEWEMAVASTFNDHVVVIGLGHLGYRVSHHLHAMDQDVVAIELKTDTDLVSSVKNLGIPVLEDDGSRETILKAAGVKKASAIMLCTQNDGMNLQIALKARSLNPEIQVVVRIFDDDFAKSLQKQFGFQALSATASASPIFAASAVGLDMTRPIWIDDRPMNLGLIEVENDSSLIGKTVQEIEELFDICVILQHQGQGKPDFHPSPEKKISHGDQIAVLGDAKQINTLAHLKILDS